MLACRAPTSHGRTLRTLPTELYALICRHQSTQAVQSSPTPTTWTPQRSALPRYSDPFALMSQELSHMRSSITQLLGSRHPALDRLAKYYFAGGEAKQIRPMIVLLLSQATNGMSPLFADIQSRSQLSGARLTTDTFDELDINEPISPEEVLSDVNPDADSLLVSQHDSSLNILPAQRRLAEITEMIHVASLLHDDVIDLAETRRQRPSAPSAFGNKLSILGGDFLLARASLYLSRLGSNEVVELVASVLANLVEGEVMQMQGNAPLEDPDLQKLTPEIMQHYMTKTYLKTASLIAKSARAAVVLGGCGKQQGWAAGESVKHAAYSYGRNLGIAFQLIDDMLDFTSSAAIMGKPSSGADLKLGLATAPVLYAWEEHAQLGPLIQRKFEQPGDVAMARDLVARSSGTAKTAELAAHHAKLAREALQIIPDSEGKAALEGLTQKVLDRSR